MYYVLLIAALLLNVVAYIFSVERKFVEEAILCTLVLLSFYYCLSLFYKRGNYLSIIAVGVAAVFLATNQALGLGTYLIYGQPFNYGFALSILNVSVREAWSMFLAMPIGIVLFALLVLLNFYVVMHFPFKIKQVFLNYFLAACCLLIPLGTLLFFQYQGGLGDTKAAVFFRNNMFYNARTFAHALQEHEERKNIKKSNADYTHLKHTEQGIETLVLVIGESARRQNMSLYGYDRITTPEQDKQRARMKLYTQMVSPAALTLLSVPMLLSNIPPERFQDSKAQFADNILAMANHLGYTTSWLSNQEQGGRFVFTISNMAQFALEQQWYASYDEVLLAPVERIIHAKGGKRLIVLHINGSHANACDKVPQKDVFFQGDNVALDCYDNSILYTDKLLGKLFSLLEDKNAALVYLSDHGQKYEGNRFFHADSQEATQVPYYIWYADGVRQSLKDIRSVEEKASLQVNYYEIAKLMGVMNLEMPKFEPLMYLKSDLSLIEYNNLAP